MRRVRRGLELPFLLTPYPQLFPDSPDPEYADLDTVFGKIGLEPFRTIGPAGALMGSSYLRLQSFFLLCSF